MDPGAIRKIKGGRALLGVSEWVGRTVELELQD